MTGHGGRLYRKTRYHFSDVFLRLMNGLPNPLLAATGGVVTRAVFEHPLYQALLDLEARPGVTHDENLTEPSDASAPDPPAAAS